MSSKRPRMANVALDALSRLGRSALGGLARAAAVLLIWFAVLAAATAVVAPSSVMVIGPRDALLRALATSDARLRDTGPLAQVGLWSRAEWGANSGQDWGFITLEASHRETVLALYAAGALIVLPARRSGCGTRQLSGSRQSQQR